MSFTTMSTFCDDIRQEISGKVSLIGLYGSHMFVTDFPARLPKLCVNFAGVISGNENPAESVKFYISQDDEVVHEMELGPFPNPEEIGQPVRFGGGVDMPFFEVHKDTVLEAYFELNGEKIDPCSLIITTEKK